MTFTQSIPATRVRSLLLGAAESARGAWTHPEATRALLAQAYEGAAHDLICGCEDSTISHLAEWVAMGSEHDESQPQQTRGSTTDMSTGRYIDIVMTTPPGPNSEFVEVEDQDGAGMKFGDWVHRPDGFWALRITPGAPTMSVEEHLLLCPHGAVLCFRCVNDAVVEAIRVGILQAP